MSILKRRWKQFERSLSLFIGHKPSFFEKLYFLWDFVWAFIFHGVSIIEYFQWDFYYKNFRGRSNFVTLRKFAKLSRHYNNKDYSKYFDDKVLFLQTFNKYVHREFLDLNTASYEQFQDMFARLGEIIVKPHNATHGIGVRKLNYKDTADVQALYEQLKSENCFVEQVIHQIEDIARLNRSSVNTLRVNTLIRDNGEIDITNVTIRIGSGDAVADNLHNNGVCATVDRETGVVISRGADLQLRNVVYHPDSHEQIIGFKIPCWDKITATVKEMATVIPQMRYVGWDIAVDEQENIVVLEGNNCAGFGLQQLPLKRGVWDRYKW